MGERLRGPSFPLACVLKLAQCRCIANQVQLKGVFRRNSTADSPAIARVAKVEVITITIAAIYQKLR